MVESAQLTACAGPSSNFNACWRCLLYVQLCLLAFTLGCGATKSHTATEQLLISDAVDATVAQLDFSPLSKKTVFLDTTYLKTQKSPLLIDSDYVISSLRQQMVGAGVLLVEGREEADIIAEARMGALGLDSHTVTYGVPANNAISSASSVFTNTPLLPALPEMSIARREAKLGAAKLAVFAYERETRLPYWQSGIAKSSSNAKDTWLLGAGPWQRGTIYEGTRFAGAKIEGTQLLSSKERNLSERELRNSQAFGAYRQERLFEAAKQGAEETEKAETEIAEGESPVVLTGGEETVETP